MRTQCLDCTLKHLSQALVLETETHKGYPEHYAYVIGHMAEAEDESVTEYPELSRRVRELRLKYMDDRSDNITPQLETLVAMVDAKRQASDTLED